MKKYLSILIVLAAGAAAADLPAAYSNVDRVLYVVRDAEAAARSWARAGIPVSLPQKALMGSLPVRSASVFFENVTVEFLQPESSGGVFADFLKRTQGGGMALVHAFPDRAAVDAEVKRLKALGVSVLLDSERYVLLDTAKEGKYVLGLGVGSDRKPMSATQRVTQYAFTSRDLQAISAYWQKLGFPAMTYSHPDMSELVYRGKPGQFDMQLGWHRFGKVPYEWIQPLKGPSTYLDHIERHGEGFHHLAFNVEDMDQAIARWEKAGFPMTMGGAWGEKGKAGSGRFAYHDLQACCASEIELLWNFRSK